MKVLSASVLGMAVVIAPLTAHADCSAGDGIKVLQGFKAGGQ